MELAIDEVAGHAEHRAIGDRDREVVAQNVDQGLLDGDDHLVAALDLERPVHVRERLAYHVERVAGQVHQRVDATQTHNLAGYFVRVISGLVLDPQVAA